MKNLLGSPDRTAVWMASVLTEDATDIKEQLQVANVAA